MKSTSCQTCLTDPRHGPPSPKPHDFGCLAIPLHRVGLVSGWEWGGGRSGVNRAFGDGVLVCSAQDDAISVEDVDKVMRDGLGPRYAFLGPLETCHLNADGTFRPFYGGVCGMRCALSCAGSGQSHVGSVHVDADGEFRPFYKRGAAN